MSLPNWTQVPTLGGRHVRLAPLEAAHAPALGEAAADGELWRLVYTLVPSREEAMGYVADALAMQARGEALPFVVMDADGAVVGTTRFYHLDPRVPRLTVGYTWYARRVQRTGLNTEAKRLLLAHAFDTLGCASVAFETSHLNLQSQAAIERLGARRDGILRGHLRHRDGSLRDTHIYSILADEWPQVRDRLDERLDATHD
ncbi:GNAT family N-acetyltransferase [Lysobacter humi (ex Lee et al. 2017)]